MARLLAFLALALLAAAVAADDEYRYTEEQTDELDARIAHCVSGVSAAGAQKAAHDCHWAGINELDENAEKEALSAVVAGCLEQRGVAAAAVAEARVCLEAAMARTV